LLRRRKDRDPGSGSARSGAAVIAGTGGTTWFRVLPSRDSVALRRLGWEDRQGRRQDCEAAHQCRIYCLLVGVGEEGTVGKQIHIVLDNLSAHKTKAVGEFLEQNPKVRLHFTPTYSSWQIGRASCRERGWR